MLTLSLFARLRFRLQCNDDLYCYSLYKSLGVQRNYLEKKNHNLTLIEEAFNRHTSTIHVSFHKKSQIRESADDSIYFSHFQTYVN